MTIEQSIWQETYNIVLRETKDPKAAADAADTAVARFKAAQAP